MKISLILSALLFAPALLLADPAPATPPASAPAAEFARRPALRQWVKKKFDGDQDGKLSETEREAAKAAFKEKGGEIRTKVMEKFDADHDGKLNQTERESAKAALTARKGAKNKATRNDDAGNKAVGLRQLLLERFDADKDGQLSETERAKAREARKNRSGG